MFALVGECPLTSIIYHQLKDLIVMMNFGNSPLLDMGTSQQQPQMIDAELQKMYEAIQQKRASINMQAQQSQTPLWDEIDKIEDNLTGSQKIGRAHV